MDMTEESSLVETPYLKHVEGSIKNFFDLPTDDNYHIDSPCFSLYGASWFLKIFTNGHMVENSVGWVSLYLNKNVSALEYLTDFRMGIKTYDSSDFEVIDGRHIVFRTTEDGYGRSKFIERWHLKILKDTLAPRGTLTIFCTARIANHRPIPYNMEAATQTSVTSAVSVESPTSSSDGVTALIENFKDLYLSKRGADIRIKVKGKQFLVHRNILTARSTVFYAMLTKKFSSIVEINDCDPLSFEDFLLFLYTGDLGVVSINNAAGLYATAEKYDLKDLKEECVRCMTSKLNADSFYDVIHLASVYNMTNVLMAATNYFLKNAKDILMTLKWQNFSTEHPSLGMELFLKYVSKK